MSSISSTLNRIMINNTTFTVYELVTEYVPPGTDVEGTICVPDSQRNWSWVGKNGITKMVKLVDSVFMGFPIPSCIFNKTRRSGGICHIYDGRHRIETLYKFYNDGFKWHDKLFSELCVEDQRVFLDRTIPVTVTTMASNNDLAEMFIRLNAGAPLKDSDLFWANRHTPFVSAVIRLVCNNDRLSRALGNLNMSNRPDLSNWVALIAGLHKRNAGNMTRSYVRICAEIGLDTVVDEAIIHDDISLFCALLEDANDSFPATDATKRKLKVVGTFGAFFFANLMAEGADIAVVVNKWHGIVGRLRGSAAKKMKMALRARGSANMTNSKIMHVLEVVDHYLETNEVDGDETDEEDDSV